MLHTCICLFGCYSFVIYAQLNFLVPYSAVVPNKAGDNSIEKQKLLTKILLSDQLLDIKLSFSKDFR